MTSLVIGIFCIECVIAIVSMTAAWASVTGQTFTAWFVGSHIFIATFGLAALGVVKICQFFDDHPQH